jgi:hypothetical protein
MPKPILTECGGENQPPCPPVPAASVEVGDGVEIEGVNYVVELENEQGDSNEQGQDTEG